LRRRTGGRRNGRDAAFSAVQAEWTMLVPAVLPYRPGEFFLRELPLRTVLARVRTLGLLVIDGCADLDPGGGPGLGTQTQGSASRSSTWPRPGCTRPATRVGLPGNGRSSPP